MRFQITGQGWPLGAFLAPSGTIFDYDKPDMWTALAPRGLMPINATPLDDEAYQAGRNLYGPPPGASR